MSQETNPINPISRRTFLSVVALAGASAILAACGVKPEVPSGPLGRINQEIEKNLELEKIEDYPDFSGFITSCYELVKERTGLGNPQEIAANSKLGNAFDIQKAFEDQKLDARAGEGYIEVDAKTTGVDGDKNKLRIVYDSSGYNLTRIKDVNKRLVDFPKSVLALLFNVAIHEVFHYLAEVRKIANTYFSETDQVNMGFDFAWGMALYGKLVNDGENPTYVVKLAQVDELTVCYLSKDLFGDSKFFTNLHQKFPSTKIDAAMEFFTKLGYDTPDKILQLRNSQQGGAVELIEKIAEVKRVTNDVAYELLETFDSLLNGSSDSKQIREYINVMFPN